MGTELELNEQDRDALLRIARSCVRSRASGDDAPTLPDPLSDDLQQPAGAFVTLRVRTGGELRGCVGTFKTDRSLAAIVTEMAQASASRDPRFDPVTPDEVDGLEIEISVLSVPYEIDHVGEIEVGKHGLRLRRGGKTGVLLPQVATRQHWSAEEFLTATCQKAGLSNSAWREDSVTIEVFSTLIFHD